MQSLELTLDTRNRRIVDITREVGKFCRPLGDGLVSVFAPHATAGLALIETGPAPRPTWRRRWAGAAARGPLDARDGSAGHGADHVLPAFVSPSLVVPVFGGAPALGVWQSIVLVDLNVDNPVGRCALSFLAG